MKIAYRIVTPILALGSVALGIFLKMFYFVIGSVNNEIGTLVNAISQLSGGKFSTTYEYSVYELLKMLAEAAGKKTEEGAKTLTEIISPIMPQIISFFVFFILAALVCVAIAVIAAALKDTKKKRHTVIGLSAAGLVLLFVCIIVSNSAFAKIAAGDINLTDLITAVSSSSLAALATTILTVTEATLSAGFYAMFGIFIVLIIWTIVASFVIKTPIQKAKKAYKRKKPMRKITASKKKGSKKPETPKPQTAE